MSIVWYGASGILAFLLSAVFTFAFRNIAMRFGIVDRPDGKRKKHANAIPLLGGMGIFLAFFLVSFTAFFVLDLPLLGDGYVNARKLLGFFAACLVLVLGGGLDDARSLPWYRQIVFPLLAVSIMLGSGVIIETITNPFGGSIHLDRVWWLPALFTALWLLLMSYTTKLLDGVDGLVSSITVIGSVLLFLVSLRPDLLQYDTALLAIVFAGASAGFLAWNFHPAKIFLGEGGSLLCGFVLGTLAIIAGGKISTAILVMGIPMLDLFWVIVRRLMVEKRFPLSGGDRKHLHFRLLDRGLSPRQTVGIFSLLSLGFGSSILFIQGRQKVIAFFAMALVMLVLALFLVKKTGKKP